MPDPQQPTLIGFARTYASGTRIEPHTHNAHQLIHAISGTMRVSARGALWILPIGRALWIPADVEHGIDCNGTVGMRTAYFSIACSGLPNTIRMWSVTPLAREVLVRLPECQDEAFRSTLGEVLNHEIKTAPVETFSLPLATNPRIAHLAESLRANPASGRTITQWARRLGFSERNLIRQIREETGMTFRELRRQTRVLVAIERLTAGDSVTDVALSVGFETPSAFISAFRRVTGKTPRQFVRAT